MKKEIIIGLIIIVFIVVFAGCIENDSRNNNENRGTLDSRLIGEWFDQDNDISYILKSNGSYYYNESPYIYYKGIWRVNGDKICITLEGSVEMCQRFELSNDGKICIIYDGNTSISELIKK